MSSKAATKPTGLAVIQSHDYLALRDAEALADFRDSMVANQQAGGSAGESMFLRIKTPSGGATHWSVDGEPVKAIEGILVGAFARGLIWPSDTSKEGTLPCLRTDDRDTAYIVGDVPRHIAEAIAPYETSPGVYDWQRLTGNGGPFGWGTGKDGHGKAAKEQRVLFILRAGDMLPVMVTLGPGSLKAWSPFLDDLSRKSIAYWRAVVSLTLDAAKSAGGTTYSKICLELKGVLSKEDGAAIKRNYTDMLARNLASMSADSDAE